MKKERYVVFSQSMDRTSRVNYVYGPFNSYNKALDFVFKLRIEDSTIWHGIRILRDTKDV